jgi:hypothetical protein
MRVAVVLLTLAMAGPAAAAARAAEGPAYRWTVAVAPVTLPPDLLAEPGAAGLGEGLAAVLTTALVDSGRFVVVERPAGAAVPASLDVVPSVPGPPAAEAPPHQLLLMAAVTELSQARRESGFSIGLGLGATRLGLSPQKVTGRVALDVRAVDSESGRVVAAFSVHESFTARAVSAGLERGALTLGRTQAGRTPAAEAARRALHAAVERLGPALAGHPWAGRVVDVEAGEVSINAGAAAGIRVGDTFQLFRTTRVLTDPVTGRVLGARRVGLGRVRVTAVDAGVAFGVLAAEGGVLPQRGDVAVLLP